MFLAQTNVDVQQTQAEWMKGRMGEGLMAGISIKKPKFPNEILKITWGYGGCRPSTESSTLEAGGRWLGRDKVGISHRWSSSRDPLTSRLEFDFVFGILNENVLQWEMPFF